MAEIIVDSREGRSGLAKRLEAAGARITIKELESGDYVIAEGVGVERKAAGDFVSSILDGRLMPQIELLSVSYERPFFMIEGDIFNTRSEIREEALLGALSYISLLKRIPILYTSNVAQTAQLLLTMHRHATEGLGYLVPMRGGKPKDRSSQAQFLVEGLPGVGPSSAIKLLEHFGTPKSVFLACETDLRKVPGIGPKTVATIREVLEYEGKPFNQTYSFLFKQEQS